MRTVSIPVPTRTAPSTTVGTLGMGRLTPRYPGSAAVGSVAPRVRASLAVPRAPGRARGRRTGVRLVAPDAAALPRGAGVAVGELLNWPGVPPMFGFRDPDGNGLELVEERS